MTVKYIIGLMLASQDELNFIGVLDNLPPNHIKYEERKR